MHCSYLNAMTPLLDASSVKGMAHITGGGITENLPQQLLDGAGAEIDRGAWDVPALFGCCRPADRLPDDEMLRAFNMGIGLIVVCDAANADLRGAAQQRERADRAWPNDQGRPGRALPDRVP